MSKEKEPKLTACEIISLIVKRDNVKERLPKKKINKALKLAGKPKSEVYRALGLPIKEDKKKTISSKKDVSKEIRREFNNLKSVGRCLDQLRNTRLYKN